MFICQSYLSPFLSFFFLYSESSINIIFFIISSFWIFLSSIRIFFNFDFSPLIIFILDLLTDNLNLSHKYLDDNTNRIIQLEIDEDLKIPVVDENGNLMPEGSIVVGSDGQEYKITKLSLNSQKKLVFYKDKIEYILTWNVQNINKQLALLAIATSLVGTYFINKKDEKTKVKSR